MKLSTLAQNYILQNKPHPINAGKYPPPLKYVNHISQPFYSFSEQVEKISLQSRYFFNRRINIFADLLDNGGGNLLILREIMGNSACKLYALPRFMLTI